MKKIITYGTYDLLHVGHVNMLRRARELGDYLVVAVSSDEFNELKGKTTYFKLEDRVAILNAIQYVDEVIVENDWEQKIADVKELGIDTFVIGDDWEGEFDFLSEYCNVLYLSRTDGISTTLIKENLANKK